MSASLAPGLRPVTADLRYAREEISFAMLILQNVAMSVIGNIAVYFLLLCNLNYVISIPFAVGDGPRARNRARTARASLREPGRTAAVRLWGR
jgi:hypothetical protein